MRRWFPHCLFSQDNPAINIAKNYYAVYEEKYDDGANMSNDNWTGGVSISVVKSSELPALAAATREFLLAGTKKNDRIDVNNSGILCYDPYRDKSYHDMMGLMRKMKEDDRAQAFENYENIYRNTVVWMKSTDYNYCTYPNGDGEMASMKGFQGLSTYILRDNQSIQETYYRQSVEWYSAAGWSDIGW